MPNFEDDLNVNGKIRTGGGFVNAGTVTFFPPDGEAWFHIDNGPEGGRPGGRGRLRISRGENPGDHEIVNVLQDGNVGIGTPDPSRALHVEGGARSEIHSGGATGGLSFANRDTGSFVEVPASGERRALGMVRPKRHGKAVVRRR
jgi:hypothetical protein